MIHFMRTSTVAPGKMADAMAFAGEMIEYLGGSHAQKMQLMVPVGGNPHRLCWYTAFDNLAVMEKFQEKTLGDPKYLSILGKSAPLFVPGTSHDDIWRGV